ncbi:L-lactate dehydrogenase [Lactococcus nasutitermitis]|uniref:L-lactate dehydrogenase n=1 Tax=Lactococcus nasutitermitis TaxID=1652957 RepID=A0ABV9JGM6_9LACT|nr:L-lactate dehydrogenase [Lactococcus nasutitermitis]
MINELKKVAIVGDGAVGSTYAHTLVVDDLADEIAIIDLNKEKAFADSLDLLHALPYLSASPKKIYAADYADAKDADIVVITANAPAATFDGEYDRLKLLEKNVAMIKSITKSVVDSGFNGIFLIASNPCDIITRLVAEVSGFPKNRVIGTGTLLETSRMRQLVAEAVAINPDNVHGYVMGEHGNSSFTAWSTVAAGAKPIKEIEHRLPSYVQMDQKIREVGFDIFERKGNTSYGIAAVLARISRAIFRNENVILPVSTYLNGEYGQKDIFIGTPAVINRDGVRELLEMPLSDEELKAFSNSADILRKNFEQIADKI